MWQSYTQAQLRDAVRRQVRVRPPIDFIPGALAGAVPPTQPNPSNPLLNQLIDKVVSKVNRKTRGGQTTTPINIAVAAQTANGPLTIPLASGWTGAASFQINKIKHVWYVEAGATSSQALTWQSANFEDSFNTYWQDMAPGLPTTAWVQGYQLNIWPAPDTAGTLYATAEMGVNNPLNDADTLGQLPADMYPVIIDNVVLELCAIQPDDAVYAAQAQLIGPASMDGLQDLIGWINTQNGNYQSGLQFRSLKLYPTIRRR